jgi:mono/diheme cytochrome c family protein
VRAKYYLPILIVALVAGSNWAQEKQEPKQEAPPASKQEQQPGAPPAAVPPGQYPHTYNITPEQKERKNPIHFTDASVAEGKKLYGSQCAMCHGEKGDGKGDAAEEMKINPPDFTKPDVLAKRTDGELFTIISVGSETMPGQGERMKELQKWDIVNFLRTFEGKVPAKATDKEKEQQEHILTIPQ